MTSVVILTALGAYQVTVLVLHFFDETVWKLKIASGQSEYNKNLFTPHTKEHFRWHNYNRKQQCLGQQNGFTVAFYRADDFS